MREPFARWLATASDTALLLEHDWLTRQLNLPNAELWDSYAANREEAAAVWVELNRRKAARMNRRAA